MSKLIIETMEKYVFKVDGFIGCATAIGTNTLVTCYHCIEHFIPKGPGLDENMYHREAVISLTHPLTNQKISTTILAYSTEKDVVFLQTTQNLMNGNEINVADASLGQSYFIIVSIRFMYRYVFYKFRVLLSPMMDPICKLLVGEYPLNWITHLHRNKFILFMAMGLHVQEPREDQFLLGVQLMEN